LTAQSLAGAALVFVGDGSGAAVAGVVIVVVTVGDAVVVGAVVPAPVSFVLVEHADKPMAAVAVAAAISLNLIFLVSFPWCRFEATATAGAGVRRRFTLPLTSRRDRIHCRR
jgi:hypothetical protein